MLELASRSSLKGLFWSVERLRESTGKSVVCARFIGVFIICSLKVIDYLNLLFEFQESEKVLELLVLLLVSFPAFKNPDVVFIILLF